MKRKKTGRLSDENNQHRYRTYSAHYVCFACRKMFNQVYWGSWNDWRGASNAPKKERYPCPECGAEMQDAGKDFKPPRRHNLPQWRKVEMLMRRGYRWRQWAESRPYSLDGPRKGWSYYETIGGGPKARTLREAGQDYPPREETDR